MSKAKQKGTAFETAIVRYLRQRFPYLQIERRALQGINDKGDIAGMSIAGMPIVIECKNTRQLNISEHMRETQRETDNAHAPLGILIQHAPRVGFDKPENTGQQWAILTLDDLCSLISLINGEPTTINYLLGTGEVNDR